MIGPHLAVVALSHDQLVDIGIDRDGHLRQRVTSRHDLPIPPE